MKKVYLILIILILFMLYQVCCKTVFEKKHTEETINICFNIDDNYVKPMLVTIYSILKNNKSNSKYNFYVITEDLKSKNENLIKNFISNKQQKVIIYRIKNELPDLKNLYFAFERVNFPSVIFGRLYIGNIIPETEYRCLYLDSDILVITDLKSLYNINLGRNIVGMVKDPVTRTKPYVRGQKYYNSGVMLIDLKKWRGENIEKKVLEKMKNTDYIDKTEYPDQDLLNDVLKGRIKTLNYKYNFFVDYRYRDIKNPYIIHYLGLKPWRKTSDWLSSEQLEIVKKSPKYELYNQYEKELEIELNNMKNMSVK